MTVWRRSDDVAVVESDARSVVLNLATGDESAPVVLSGSGRAIWRLIDGVRTLDDVIAQLTADYGESREAIAPDLLRFVDELAFAGLITVVREGAEQ